jgi:hypothetical protein
MATVGCVLPPTLHRGTHMQSGAAPAVLRASDTIVTIRTPVTQVVNRTDRGVVKRQTRITTVHLLQSQKRMYIVALFTPCRLTASSGAADSCSDSQEIPHISWNPHIHYQVQMSPSKKLTLSHYTPRRRLGGEEINSYLFLTSALDGGEWSAWRPAAIYPRDRTPGTHCTGGWVGPRAGLDTEARWKILSPLPGIEPRSPGCPACSQTLYWLSYPAHKMSPSLFSVLSQLNPVHTLTLHFCDMYCNITLKRTRLQSDFLHLDLPSKIWYTFLTSACVLHVPPFLTSHLSRFLLLAVTFIQIISFRKSQFSKWTCMCRYTIPELLFCSLISYRHLLICEGKAVLLHATEALGGRGIAPTHSRPWH